MTEQTELKEAIDKMVSERSHSKIKQSRMEILYREVIQKNFQSMTQMLSKLDNLVSKQQNYDQQLSILLKRTSKVETDMDSIHNQHRRENLQLHSNIDGIKKQILDIDARMKFMAEENKNQNIYEHKNGYENNSKNNKNNHKNQYKSCRNIQKNLYEYNICEQRKKQMQNEFKSVKLIRGKTSNLLNSKQSNFLKQKSHNSITQNSEDFKQCYNVTELVSSQNKMEISKQLQIQFIPQGQVEKHKQKPSQASCFVLNIIKDQDKNVINSFSKELDKAIKELKIEQIQNQVSQKQLRQKIGDIVKSLSHKQGIDIFTSENQIEIVDLIVEKTFRSPQIENGIKIKQLKKSIQIFQNKIQNLNKKVQENTLILNESQKKLLQKQEIMSIKIQKIKQQSKSFVTIHFVNQQNFKTLQRNRKLWMNNYEQFANRSETTKALNLLQNKFSFLMQHINHVQFCEQDFLSQKFKCLGCSRFSDKNTAATKMRMSAHRSSLESIENTLTFPKNKQELKKKTFNTAKNKNERNFISKSIKMVNC